MKYNRLILILVFLILFCNFVNADLVFNEVICSKDGSLNLKVHSDDSKILVDEIKIIARQKDFFDLTILKFEVNGSWNKDYISDEKTIFESNVAQINTPGNYDIILEYIEEDVNREIVYETDCPGLIFSCELVNVDIKNCTTVDDKYFSLLVELSGINQSISRQLDIFEDISYSLVAENAYEDIKGLFSNKGSLPKDIKIQEMNKDLYLFSRELEDNNIKSVNVYLKYLQSECKDSKLYDYMGCIKIYTNEKEQEIPKEEINEEKIEQKKVPKITGEVVKIKEKNSNNNYLIYILLVVIILAILIVIIKKQKVNKWV